MTYVTSTSAACNVFIDDLLFLRSSHNKTSITGWPDISGILKTSHGGQVIWRQQYTLSALKLCFNLQTLIWFCLTPTPTSVSDLRQTVTKHTRKDSTSFRASQKKKKKKRKGVIVTRAPFCKILNIFEN